MDRLDTIQSTICSSAVGYPQGVGSHERSTVLVTGAAGYVGSLLVRRLLNKGYRVRVLDRLLFGDEALRQILDHPHLELIVADFRHAATVAMAIQHVDMVIHLGAIVGDPACAMDADFTIETNFKATAMLAEACKKAGLARFVFASTCSVYGASDDMLDEESALNPVSLYAETKIAAEQSILALQDARFKPTVMRFATAYGLSHRPRFDLVINLLSGKAVTEGQITIHGGEQWRPFIHVDDMGRALILALEAPLDKVGGQIFNVGSTEQNHRLSQVGELIQQIVPTAQLITHDTIIDRRNYYVRFDKISRVLGFHPTRTLRDGVVELTATCESGIVIPYHDRRFSNHLFLAEILSAVRPVDGAAMVHGVGTGQWARTLVEPAALSAVALTGDD